MGVRLPGLELGLRFIRWVAEKVVGERQPGAETIC